MSLLDDVSIVVTPNGYKAGELYAVVPVPTEGAEEVNDKDFLLTGTQAENTTGTYWTTGTGWTISSGTSIVTNGAIYSRLSQSLSFDLNSTYQVTIECSQFSNGYVYLRKPRGSESDTTLRVDAVGTFKFTLQALTDIDEIALSIGEAGTNLTISSISVKEVLLASADMDVTRETAATRVDEDGLVNYAEVLGDEEITDGDFPTGTTNWTIEDVWTISGNSANGNGANGSSQQLVQSSVFTIGKTYKVTYDIINYVSGSVFMPNVGSSNSGNQTYSEYITATQSDFKITGINFYGSITNISVKEVTRDNVPRIDYTGGGCPHILAEPQRTNLITYSEDFTQWDKNSGTTITLDSLISPDGTQNADLIVASGSGSRVGDNVSIVSGNTYTLSVYLKNNGGNTSITIGSYTTTQLETITINDEWNRYTTTFVASSTTTSSIRIISSGSNINLYAWGAQLEESYATSYIPTSGSTVTRNQDVFTRDGIGSLINSTEGVLFVEMAALSDDGTNRSITLSDGSTNNIIQILFSSVSNTIRFIIRVGGVGGDNLDKSTSTYTVTDFNKVALKWKQNDAQVWINGTQLGSPDTNSDVPTGLNDLSFEYLTVGNNFVGKVKQLQVYNTALTDEQLLQLTGTSGTDFYESYAEMASALTYTIQ